MWVCMGREGGREGEQVINEPWSKLDYMYLSMCTGSTISLSSPLPLSLFLSNVL